MTEYIKSCLPIHGKDEIIRQIQKLRPNQLQELDRWLKNIEKEWRRVELLKVIARADGAFEASIQSSTHFPDFKL